MHAAARQSLILQQLREGLKIYNLIDIMEKNREVYRSLFVVQGGDDKVISKPTRSICIAVEKYVTAQNNSYFYA